LSSLSSPDPESYDDHDGDDDNTESASPNARKSSSDCDTAWLTVGVEIGSYPLIA
jgi:hypothetical protein